MVLGLVSAEKQLRVDPYFQLSSFKFYVIIHSRQALITKQAR
jgi:hypothetical protein